jgi:hypothetical protein
LDEGGLGGTLVIGRRTLENAKVGARCAFAGDGPWNPRGPSRVGEGEQPRGGKQKMMDDHANWLKNRTSFATQLDAGPTNDLLER